MSTASVLYNESLDGTVSAEAPQSELYSSYFPSVVTAEELAKIKDLYYAELSKFTGTYDEEGQYSKASAEINASRRSILNRSPKEAGLMTLFPEFSGTPELIVNLLKRQTLEQPYWEQAYLDDPESDEKKALAISSSVKLSMYSSLVPMRNRAGIYFNKDFGQEDTTLYHSARIATPYGATRLDYPLDFDIKSEIPDIENIPTVLWNRYFKNVAKLSMGDQEARFFICPDVVRAFAKPKTNDAFIGTKPSNSDIPLSQYFTHELVHLYTKLAFGRTAPSVTLDEGMSVLIEYLESGGNITTQKGESLGYEEAQQPVDETPVVRSNTEFLDIFEKLSTQNSREYSYRFGQKMVITIFEYARDKGLVSTLDEAVQLYMQIYADSCADTLKKTFLNTETGETVESHLVLIQNGKVLEGVRQRDIIEEVLVKNGIDIRSDMDFYYRLYDNLKDGETPDLFKMFNKPVSTPVSSIK